MSASAIRACGSVLRLPSMWSFLMDALEQDASDHVDGREDGRGDVGAMRWVLLGGEAVPAALVRRGQRLVPPSPRLLMC